MIGPELGNLVFPIWMTHGFEDGERRLSNTAVSFSVWDFALLCRSKGNRK
jgi:hypothetical protein